MNNKQAMTKTTIFMLYYKTNYGITNLVDGQIYL